MKRLFALILATVMVISTSMMAFAGTWEADTVGWKWKNDDGTYAVSCWKWCDGNNDGIYECYYFDKDGHCLLDTTTPDGYTVNKDGAWVVDGVVQLSKQQGPSVNADAALSASNNVASTSLDSYISNIEFKLPEIFEKYKISKDSNNDICIDVYLPADTEIKESWLALINLEKSGAVFEGVANKALEFYKTSMNVTVNVYSADGVKLASQKYYGSP